MKNEKGFTLIEMLIVLFIIFTISFVSAKITIKMSEKAIVDYFFHQLLLDIQMAQTMATEKQRNVIIHFSSNNNYQIHHNLEDVIAYREIPNIIQFNAEASDMITIRINHKGHIEKFGKVIFNTPFGKKTLMIYIAKGRARYVE